MFWKITLMTSKIDTILDKDNVTLKELMEEDDILQECKAQNRKLIGFLTQPAIMRELVELATTEPDPDVDEITRFKYTNIACELLTSDVSAINDALVNGNELLDGVYSFLEQVGKLKPGLVDTSHANSNTSANESRTGTDSSAEVKAQSDSASASASASASVSVSGSAPTVTNHTSESSQDAEAKSDDALGAQPNPLMASFFAKIVNLLLSRRTDKALSYLIERHTFLSLLVRYVATPAIADCIGQLFGLVEKAPGESRHQLVDWFIREAFIQQLINVIRVPKPGTECNTEAFCNASQTLCEIVRMLREQTCLMTEKEEPERLLATFDDPVVLDLLLNNILPPRASDNVHEHDGEETHVAAIVQGLQLIQALLDFRKHSPANTGDAMGDASGLFRGELGGGSNGINAEMPFGLGGLGGAYGLSATAFLIEPRRIQRTCDAVVSALRRRLPSFVDTLRSPPKGIHRSVPTPSGRLLEAPCGAARIAVLSILNSLLQTTLSGSAPADSNCEAGQTVLDELVRLGYVQVLVDAFFAYSWNNFLHTQVERSIGTIVQALSIKLRRSDDAKINSTTATNNSAPEANANQNDSPSSDAMEKSIDVLLKLVRNLLVDSGVMRLIVDAHKANAEAELSNRPRAAYMGHLVRITNQISDLLVRSGAYAPTPPPPPPTSNPTDSAAAPPAAPASDTMANASESTLNASDLQQRVALAVRAMWNECSEETRNTWRAFITGPLDEINRANVLEKHIQLDVDSDEGEPFAPTLNEPKTSNVSLQRSFDDYQQLASQMVTNFPEQFGIAEASYTDVPRTTDMENLLDSKLASLTAHFNGPDEPSGASEFERLCNVRLRSTDEDDEEEEHDDLNESASEADEADGDGDGDEDGEEDTTAGDDLDADSSKHTDEDDDADIQVRNPTAPRYAPLAMRSNKLPKLTLAEDFTEKPLVFASTALKTTKWETGFEKLDLSATGDSDEDIADGGEPRRSSDSDEDEGAMTVRSPKNSGQSQPSTIGLPLIGLRSPFHAWSDDDDHDASRRSAADNQSKRTSRYIPRFDDEDEVETTKQKISFDDIPAGDSFDELVQRAHDDSSDKVDEDALPAAEGRTEPQTGEDWADFSAFSSAMVPTTTASELSLDDVRSRNEDESQIALTLGSPDRAGQYALGVDDKNESES